MSDPIEHTFAVSLEFTADALTDALMWADARGLSYEDHQHLLFDAMINGVIKPSNGFEEVNSFGKI